MESVISLNREVLASPSIARSCSSILEIKSLNHGYWGEAAYKLLERQDKEYIRYYSPLPLNPHIMQMHFTGAVRDFYLGIFSETTLIGLAFLRGWDSGFPIPAVGLMVDERYGRRGFASAALQVLEGLAVSMESKMMIAKVYDGNERSTNFFLKHKYYLHQIETGFKIYAKELNVSGI